MVEYNIRSKVNDFTNKLKSPIRSICSSYFAKLCLLGLFVVGTMLVFYGVVLEFQARENEQRQIELARKRKARRMKKYGRKSNNLLNRLDELERFNTEVIEDIISGSATRTITFIIIALGAVLQVVAYITRFNWALFGQDSIIGVADSKHIYIHERKI